jgi:hypothetical protein
MIRASLCLSLLLAPAIAQTVDTLGATTTAPSRAATGKASVFRVDSSVLMLDYEMYLNVPGPETLTWFVYRHHSRTGVATMEWTQQVAVNGTGVGPAWYSAGPIALPLVEGNHYMIGVSWPGTLVYYYNTSSQPLPVSFGSWQRAHTTVAVPPATFTIASGIDTAVYNQRLTTVPFPNVDIIGNGCSGTALVPRLVASGVPTLGATKYLDLVDATANSLGMVSLALGPTLPVAIPMFGCGVWLNLGGATATTALVTSGTGVASLPMSLPANPIFQGLPLSAQAGVLTTNIDITNALNLVVN